MLQTVVVDCRGHMLGRLASILAKQLLSGQSVVSTAEQWTTGLQHGAQLCLVKAGCTDQHHNQMQQQMDGASSFVTAARQAPGPLISPGAYKSSRPVERLQPASQPACLQTREQAAVGESCGSGVAAGLRALRGDQHLRRDGQAEDEVRALPEQAHEHQPQEGRLQVQGPCSHPVEDRARVRCQSWQETTEMRRHGGKSRGTAVGQAGHRRFLCLPGLPWVPQ
jgi:hypothetical protein